MIIDETNEVLICYLIKQYNCEITVGVAKKLRKIIYYVKRILKNII